MSETNTGDAAEPITDDQDAFSDPADDYGDESSSVEPEPTAGSVEPEPVAGGSADESTAVDAGAGDSADESAAIDAGAGAATRGKAVSRKTAGKVVARPTKTPASSKAADSGRMTPKGGATARGPVTSGRYTPPIPREVRHSPQWFPFVLIGCLVLGLLMIVLNYVNVLPGGTNNWYLIGGIGAIVVGLFMATFYH